MDKHHTTDEAWSMMSDLHIVTIKNTITESMAKHMTTWNKSWLEIKKHHEDQDKLKDRSAANWSELIDLAITKTNKKTNLRTKQVTT